MGAGTRLMPTPALISLRLIAGAMGAALILVAVCATTAFADVTSVATATATPHYSHPITGVIEDSGGESSYALGQSMVDGVTGTQALVELDATGATYVTVRFSLYSELGDIVFSYDADGSGSSYMETSAVLMQENTAENTADFRFYVASADSVIRCSLFATPMGRSVVFYITLSDLVAGNTAGFIESVVAGEEIVASGLSEETVDESTDESDTAALVEELVNASGDSASGIREFDAQGNEVVADTENSAPSSSGDSATLLFIVVGIVGAVIVCGTLVYVAWYKPRRAKQDAAAAAALQDASSDNGSLQATLDTDASDADSIEYSENAD